MENLKQILGAIFYDSEFEKGIRVVTELIGGSPDGTYSENLRKELENILEVDSKELHEFVTSSMPLGILKPPKEVVDQYPDYVKASIIFLEKIYHDLFKDDPDFKPELITLLEMENTEDQVI